MIKCSYRTLFITPYFGLYFRKQINKEKKKVKMYHSSQFAIYIYCPIKL